jgi:hypothetical protein
MIQRILENLSRQLQALKVLKMLQEEEFSHLKAFRPQSVGAVEFSIQELMRQIMVERTGARRMMRIARPSAVRMSDLAEDFGDAWEHVKALLEEIKAMEQVCAKQAEKSHILAKALFDQTSGYVSFFTKKLIPKKESYGRRGVFANAKPAPAMLRGTS